MLLGSILALVSAFSFAAAGALQHTATNALARRQTIPHRTVLPVLGLLGDMMSSRIWWLGFLCNVCGFAIHATALHLASITIVQALLSVQMLFAWPLAAWRTRRQPLPRDWIATAAVCLGICTLVISRGTVTRTMDRQSLTPLVIIAAVTIMALLLFVARIAHSNFRTALIGTAAGTGFSLTAVLIVIVTDLVVHSGWSTVTRWPLYALAASGLIAAILAQDAFASGSLPAALTAMTIADPVMSWLWGAILFDQVPPSTPTAMASLALSAALIGVGVGLLAHSPTLAKSC